MNIAKKEARKAMKARIANQNPQQMDSIEFKMKASQLYYLDDMGVVFMNQKRATIQNQILSNSKNWGRICELRRHENSSEISKTELANLIKKSLIEELNTNHKVYCQEVEGGEFNEDNLDEWITMKSQILFDNDPALVFLTLGKEELMKEIEEYLETLPLYTNFLKNIKGLGAKTSAKLIAGIGDMTRFENPAKLWKYCGYGSYYIDDTTGEKKAAKKKAGVQMDWNPKMKSLMFIIGENMIKKGSPYKTIYNKRKEITLFKHPEWHNLNPDGTKNTGKNMHPKHAHNDAQRVMIKRFLAELWVAGYKAQGIEPPCLPYGVEIQGHHLEPQIVEYC